ncbi:MAG: hypothetical protein AB7E79_04685 [Rhodospirillaceae bacterium]
MIPAHGALQVSVADILGDAEAEDDARFVADVRATFKGQVQHVSWSGANGVVSNLTACRRLASPKRGLGYISGPGATDLEGAIRILNEGRKPRAQRRRSRQKRPRSASPSRARTRR